jgi:hypothetical protein
MKPSAPDTANAGWKPELVKAYADGRTSSVPQAEFSFLLDDLVRPAFTLSGFCRSARVQG